MISYLKGKIQNKGQGFVIVNIQDIGYKVFVNEALWNELNIRQVFELYVYQQVREDALNLYGFKDLEQLEMFEMFLSISGVGPKSALSVLAIANMKDIKESISRGDSSLLIKVSGIGKKTAERMVLELRDKIIAMAHHGKFTADRGEIQASSDEIDGLVALGYSFQQAREALGRVDPKIRDSSERIKEALRSISN